MRPHPAGKTPLVLDLEPAIRIDPSRQAGSERQLRMRHSWRPIAAGDALVGPFGVVMVLKHR